jgi:hypothetical protein
LALYWDLKKWNDPRARWHGAQDLQQGGERGVPKPREFGQQNDVIY